MAVLITGGAGYIGSVAAEQLLELGEPVVILDNLSTGHRAAVPAGAEFIHGSVLDDSLLGKLLSDHGVDTVMHFAASSLVGESCANPLKYFENNVAGALSLLKAMRRANVERIILSSTAAVYGNPDRVPISEEMPDRPLNPYGLSKRMIEQTLEWCDTAYGLRYVSLRYFNAAGATSQRGEDHRPETHLIPNVLDVAAGARQSVTIFGNDYDTPDGTCVRDYIHVSDLTDAHVKAMHYLREGGRSEIINLGNSVGHSVLQVVESARRVTGREIPTVYSARRPGDADRLVASSEKARSVLGWKPRKAAIDDIVSDAWEWRRRHPEGYPD
ncbi:MAG: UDP-glucose 4-epimerase GalE [Candidatus Hydrogenedentes bacterium]|nr:UDP-glucose 4-epimerase GalE [Candidatus Hydrogenedentota bacterium]